MAGRCTCEATGLDENFYKLVPMESPQRKPQDSCIRAWMGGEWVEKKQGWSGEAERAFGGDGYHGVSLKIILVGVLALLLTWLCSTLEM